MVSPVPSVLCPPRLALLPEQREAMLRQLAAPSPAWEAIASVVQRDPALLHAILDAAPLAAARLGSKLNAELSARLERLGADLLRAWLLQLAWSQHPPGEFPRRVSARALLVAECALHLALETRYPHPDEAYLAGLWHELGELCFAAQPAPSGAAPGAAAALTEQLARRAGVRGPLADALVLHHMEDELCLAAHPLVRLLWAAKRLAGESWKEEAARVGPILGLSREAVLALRHDVGYLAAAQPPGTGLALPATPAEGGDGALREIVLTALVRGAFTGLPPDTVSARLAMGARLLCDAAAPLVVVAGEDDTLRALPFAGRGEDDIPAWFAELGQRLDDATSVVARALRSGDATAFNAAGTRSACDRHLVRWLGRDGFMCLPLDLPDTRAVAVIGSDAEAPPAPYTTRLLGELARAAAAAVLASEREAAAREAGSRRIEERFREHLRRIAHEAGNPLSVIKSHLDIMARQHGDDASARTGLQIVHAELDRIGALLQAAAQPPAEQPEAATCRVPELLRELHTLYAEPLFGKRGIRFEVRCAGDLPAAAMPRSALTQVLLNLFRNAAEALHPGGSFIVSVPGQVLSDGIPCLELRVIDNGPGLPPQRLADLFATHPSTKGEAHQGLGLAIVRDILRKWSASILCRSQPGTGTSFQLFIPLDKGG